jgi:DNA polymerase III subunit epsilon
MGLFDRLKAARTDATPPPPLPAPPPVAAEAVNHQSVLDRYYRALDRLERSKKRQAFGEALQIAGEMCDNLGGFVDAWRREELEIHDGYLPANWFEIQSIPAVDLLCRLATARVDSTLLDRAEAGCRQRPELAAWLVEIEAARDRLPLAEKLFVAIGETPGVKQAGLAKSLGADGNEVRNIIYWAEADGRVIRTESGSTYELWLPHDAPAGVVSSTAPHATKPAARPRRPKIERPLPTPPDSDRITGLTAGTFAAIDFETATWERASACAVSIVLVTDGQLGESQTWLIQPPGNIYEGWNTMLHGIGPDDTEGQPGFEDVFPEVLAFIGDRPVIAHYAPFDFGVIRAEHLRIRRPWPAMTVACSVVMSRRAWPGLVSYSLPMVADFLDLDPLTHHDATADAMSCAEIVRRVFATTEADDLDGVADALGIGIGRLEPAAYQPCLARFSGRWEFERPASGDLDPDHPFNDVDIAFTGTLMSMTRREAAQLVVNAGGRFSTSVSGKTEYLVFGEQDFTKFVDGERSSKTKKAEELLADGHHIQVISEADFLRMLGGVNPHQTPTG